MKKIFMCLIAMLLLNLSITYAQDVKEVSTKMDSFASKTGVIIKFIDYELPNLKLKSSIAETKIRKLISGDEVGYFYQISYAAKYDKKMASIAYEDLIEVLKALETLKLNSIEDKALTPDYLENKFVTDDGFQLGYYVSSGKLVWYLTLEKYGSGNSVFIKDVLTIETAFLKAKQKIEELQE